MTRPDWVRAAFGAHYPALYRHRDEAEARRCIALVDRLVGLGGRRVLDLGCGAGRHLPFLEEAGAGGMGMDQSPELLAEAHRCGNQGAAFRLVRGDWGRIPAPDHAFDVVLSLFTAFGYGDHPAEQRSMLGEIARVLDDGGRWLLDYLNPRLVRRELESSPPPRERRVEGLTVRDERSLGADARRVEKSVTVTDADGRNVADYVESVALMDLDELDALAAAAGLVPGPRAGDYDGAPFDADASPRWILTYVREAPA